MLIAEGRRRGRAAEAGADDIGDIDTLLFGRRSDAGDGLAVLSKDNRRVADRENLRMPRDREVGFNPEAPCLVCRRVQPERGWRGLNAGGPDLAGSGDRFEVGRAECGEIGRASCRERV